MVLLRIKLALLGDSKIGKTALSTVFHGKAYPKNYNMTLGVDFLVKTVKIPEVDAQVEIYIMDTAGNPIYKHMRSKYWEGCNAVMLAYDMTSKESFRSLAKWFDEFKQVSKGEHKEQQKTLGVVVGLKSDMKDYAEVKVNDAQNLATEHGFGFFECSALTPKDVDAPFMYLANTFHSKYEAQLKAMAELNA